MPCRKNRGGQVSFLEMDCWFAQLPRRGTALVGLSLDGFLLLLFLSKSVIDMFHTWSMVWLSMGRPLLPTVWCDCLLGDSPLYWTVFLQIDKKTILHRIKLFK